VIGPLLSVLGLAWDVIKNVFTHRASRIAAAVVAIFAAGWFVHRQPVAVTKIDTKTDTKEASYSMGRIGLRIKGGTTILTLNADGVVISIQNTGGELLLVQRTSSTRIVDTQTHHKEDDRIPPPPLPGGPISRIPRWGLGVGAGIGTDLVPRYGAIGTMHLLGPFDAAAVVTVPPAVYGFALARW